MFVNRLKVLLIGCLILTGAVLLGGCGSGSSGSPSTLQLTVEAASVPSGTTLGSIQANITVPTGVDIAASATGEVQSGLITAAGTAAAGSPQVIGNYNADSRQLTVNVISPVTGFGNGACAIVSFSVSPGATVSAADFTVTSVQARDYTTAAIVAGVVINLKQT
jgi:hypothetical protein